MSIAYHDMINRLIQERRRLSLSQKEMGRFMRMSQSNYSKVELGKRRISYYELKYLSDSDVDLFYLFTGRRNGSDDREYLEGRSYSELLCIWNILASLSDLDRLRGGRDGGRNRLSWAATAWTADRSPKGNRNLFSHIRSRMGYSQKKTAELLGIDVKKLRDLEKGRNMPDSELLCRMQEIFGISPAVMIQDPKGLKGEICALLEDMEPDRSRMAIAALGMIPGDA